MKQKFLSLKKRTRALVSIVSALVLVLGTMTVLLATSFSASAETAVPMTISQGGGWNPGTIDGVEVIETDRATSGSWSTLYIDNDNTVIPANSQYITCYVEFMLPDATPLRDSEGLVFSYRNSATATGDTDPRHDTYPVQRQVWQTATWDIRDAYYGNDKLKLKDPDAATGIAVRYIRIFDSQTPDTYLEWGTTSTPDLFPTPAPLTDPTAWSNGAVTISKNYGEYIFDGSNTYVKKNSSWDSLQISFAKSMHIPANTTLDAANGDTLKVQFEYNSSNKNPGGNGMMQVKQYDSGNWKTLTSYDGGQSPWYLRNNGWTLSTVMDTSDSSYVYHGGDYSSLDGQPITQFTVNANDRDLELNGNDALYVCYILVTVHHDGKDYIASWGAPYTAETGANPLMFYTGTGDGDWNDGTVVDGGVIGDGGVPVVYTKQSNNPWTELGLLNNYDIFPAGDQTLTCDVEYMMLNPVNTTDRPNEGIMFAVRNTTEGNNTNDIKHDTASLDRQTWLQYTWSDVSLIYGNTPPAGNLSAGELSIKDYGSDSANSGMAIRYIRIYDAANPSKYLEWGTPSANDLFPSLADKSALQDAIDNQVTDLSGYTAASAQAYTDALDAGQTVLDDDYATQAQVDAATQAILDAKDALAYKQGLRNGTVTISYGNDMLSTDGSNTYIHKATWNNLQIQFAASMGIEPGATLDNMKVEVQYNSTNKNPGGNGYLQMKDSKQTVLYPAGTPSWYQRDAGWVTSTVFDTAGDFNYTDNTGDWGALANQPITSYTVNSDPTGYDFGFDGNDQMMVTFIKVTVTDDTGTYTATWGAPYAVHDGANPLMFFTGTGYGDWNSGTVVDGGVIGTGGTPAIYTNRYDSSNTNNQPMWTELGILNNFDVFAKGAQNLTCDVEFMPLNSTVSPDNANEAIVFASRKTSTDGGDNDQQYQTGSLTRQTWQTHTWTGTDLYYGNGHLAIKDFDKTTGYAVCYIRIYDAANPGTYLEWGTPTSADLFPDITPTEPTVTETTEPTTTTTAAPVDVQGLHNGTVKINNNGGNGFSESGSYDGVNAIDITPGGNKWFNLLFADSMGATSNQMLHNVKVEIQYASTSVLGSDSIIWTRNGDSLGTQLSGDTNYYVANTSWITDGTWQSAVIYPGGAFAASDKVTSDPGVALGDLYVNTGGDKDLGMALNVQGAGDFYIRYIKVTVSDDEGNSVYADWGTAADIIPPTTTTTVSTTTTTTTATTTTTGIVTTTVTTATDTTTGTETGTTDTATTAAPTTTTHTTAAPTTTASETAAPTDDARTLLTNAVGAALTADQLAGYTDADAVAAYTVALANANAALANANATDQELTDALTALNNAKTALNNTLTTAAPTTTATAPSQTGVAGNLIPVGILGIAALGLTAVLAKKKSKK